MKQQIAMYGKSNIDPYAFLILDDLMYDAPRWIKDLSIKDIFNINLNKVYHIKRIQ